MQTGMGIDHGAIQAVSAASEPKSGQLATDKLAMWKLTGGQVLQVNGLNNARRNTERWLASIQPRLQHLAAASSAGTSLEATLHHNTTTPVTWDAVWRVYMDPKLVGKASTGGDWWRTARRTKQGVMNACATKAKNTREVDAACYIVEAVDCKQAANCGLQAIASDVLNRRKSL
ncbi:hypothetical protein QJQ45_008667 [Haematococcus lacustris]|nr:hypothetical protein QJQ45_008667 [Haematococcus lacustris]